MPPGPVGGAIRACVRPAARQRDYLLTAWGAQTGLPTLYWVAKRDPRELSWPIWRAPSGPGSTPGSRGFTGYFRNQAAASPSPPRSVMSVSST
jgi:hypothetical protein